MHPNLKVTLQQRVLDHTRQVDALDFFHLLTGPKLREQVEELLPIHRERVFPPTETLAMFLGQALSPDGSCRPAVDDAIVQLLLSGGVPQSTHTSAYCQARARLPLPMLSTLTCAVGGIVAAEAPVKWHWQGRPVRCLPRQS